MWLSVGYSAYVLRCPLVVGICYVRINSPYQNENRVFQFIDRKDPGVGVCQPILKLVRRPDSHNPHPEGLLRGIFTHTALNAIPWGTVDKDPGQTVILHVGSVAHPWMKGGVWSGECRNSLVSSAVSSSRTEYHRPHDADRGSHPPLPPKLIQYQGQRLDFSDVSRQRVSLHANPPHVVS